MSGARGAVISLTQYGSAAGPCRSSRVWCREPHSCGVAVEGAGAIGGAGAGVTIGVLRVQARLLPPRSRQQ